MARTKRSRSTSHNETSEAPATDLALTEPTDSVAVNEPSEMRPSLTHIRARALHSQTETAHTIAELEAWRAEIDATIAFLRTRS